MREPISILFLSANPWTTSRILVDEEAREIFNKLHEGPHRDRFVLHKHAAIRPSDIQRLLMMYRPNIVHYSGHSSKKQKIILGGVPGRGKQINRQALVDVFALYRQHVRLVFLNACFTRNQARSLAEVIDYSIGSRKPIGDREGVTLAGAFYRALAFGKSVREAFDSARAELALANMTRAKGVELFIRNGLKADDQFPDSRNQFTEQSSCVRQLQGENQHRGLLSLPGGSMAINDDAMHLPRPTALNCCDEAVERELLLAYDCARQASNQPMATDSIIASSTVVRRWVRGLNKSASGAKSSASVTSSRAGVFAITSATTVTFAERLVTVTSPAKGRRNREDRGALPASTRSRRQALER